MKILVIASDFPPNYGGVAMFLHNICYQLHQTGHSVNVLVPWINGCSKLDRSQIYAIYRYPSWRRRLSSVSPIWNTLRKELQYHFDIILIGHFMTTHAIGALLMNKIRSIPYAILVHGNDIYYNFSSYIDKMIGHLLLHNASLILCNSQATTERIRIKGYKGPLAILHPGVDIKDFRPDIDPTPAIRKFKFGERRVLLSVSRLVKRKGLGQVLKALPKVVKKVPDIIYVIAGSGEEEENLKRIVADMNLREYVHFTGYVDKELLPALYCVSDVFIMPSFIRDRGKDYEGFGIVYSEASACGKPVIGGLSGGIEDAVIDEETGILVDPHNEGDIASAIIRLLTDRDLARELGQKGRQRVERDLSWEKTGKKLEEYLHNVIAQTSKGA